MVKIGNFFFHYRNFMFPVFYLALYLPSPPIFEQYVTAIILGGIIALMGQIIRWTTIGLVYIIRGGKNRQVYAEKLVTDGIFAHCRNPMYVGNVLMLIGTGVLANSLYFLLIGGPFFIFVYQAIITAEENFLHNKFGAAFEVYKASTGRWIPKFKGLGTTLISMTFQWKRVILKEYNTSYVWMLGCTLLIMKQVHEHESTFEFNSALPILIGVLAIITLTYAIIKYMKKTKRFTSA
ncbi:methyltransferase family protein [Catalinimonas niigatensis]|uniref:methyltransferase family protein n=1 Tax=Catalinimonas niigatensis TaxID=1397264 RepID=UPI0026659881|nr:isoprenylcysteine carboxylmethyltransferase family protein [Catalinimonas niigatensis]WPP51849.1 isoprenylcysteine carboxylmethyltransferase family protein [Catalinimonas niigatensis]